MAVIDAPKVFLCVRQCSQSVLTICYATHHCVYEVCDSSSVDCRWKQDTCIPYAMDRFCVRHQLWLVPGCTHAQEKLKNKNPKIMESVRLVPILFRTCRKVREYSETASESFTQPMKFHRGSIRNSLAWFRKVPKRPPAQASTTCQTSSAKTTKQAPKQ